jgi:polar amino acid transport system substrate-binding protein
VDLARALAQKIGVDAQNVMYERSGAVLNGLRTNAWDIAFLVVAPERAAEVDFSTPFMQTDFTYLVRPGSPIRQVADVDQPGVRVAVPRGDASELYLSRMLKNAVVVRTDSIPIAVGLLRSEQADVYAGPRPNAIDEAARFPGSRVLDDGFGIIYRAALVPKGHPERLAYVTEFIESVKASGLIKQLIERYELQGITVAPAGKPGAY